MKIRFLNSDVLYQTICHAQMNPFPQSDIRYSLTIRKTTLKFGTPINIAQSIKTAGNKFGKCRHPTPPNLWELEHFSNNTVHNV